MLVNKTVSIERSSLQFAKAEETYSLVTWEEFSTMSVDTQIIYTVGDDHLYVLTQNIEVIKRKNPLCNEWYSLGLVSASLCAGVGLGMVAVATITIPACVGAFWLLHDSINCYVNNHLLDD